MIKDPFRVLIVEDSPTQALQIRSYLVTSGMQVIVASDGIEGLRCVHEFKPHMVLLDIHMPRMDGYQVCSRLKRDPKTAGIPVIMLTAWNTPNATTRSQEAGADSYIDKNTLTREKLLALLHKYIEIK